MPAKSKKQQQFMGLVRAVQKGEIPASKVTSNVRDAAKDMSAEDAREFASTKTKDLPTKVSDKDEDKKKDSDETSDKKDESMKNAVKSELREILSEHGWTVSKLMKAIRINEGIGGDMSPGFFNIVEKYNEFGAALRRDRTLAEIGQQLSQIAEFAEQQLTNETSDWYDAHTIGRNIKEMKAYSKEFMKVAEEADSHYLRMEALYDDMGRILERYFDVYDAGRQDGDEEVLTEPSNQTSEVVGDEGDRPFPRKQFKQNPEYERPEQERDLDKPQPPMLKKPVNELKPQTYLSAAEKRYNQAQQAANAGDMKSYSKLSRRGDADRSAANTAIAKKNRTDWPNNPVHKGRLLNKEGTKFSPVTERAINIARSKLKEHEIKVFEALSPDRKAQVSWRLISEGVSNV